MYPIPTGAQGLLSHHICINLSFMFLTIALYVIYLVLSITAVGFLNEILILIPSLLYSRSPVV